MAQKIAEKFKEAFKKNDRDAMRSHVTDDVKLFPPFWNDKNVDAITWNLKYPYYPGFAGTFYRCTDKIA